MSAAALLAAAEAVGVEFYLAGGALRYRGHLPEPLFALLWAEREAVRKLLAERCRGRCSRCGASPGPAEIGGADLAGWICDRCLARAGLLELWPESGLSTPSSDATPPPWTDLDAWCAKLGAAGPLDDRRLVLREWVDAAGGWRMPLLCHLPIILPPNGLALATLKAHARALRLEVREDPDDPALMRWLRGAPIDMEASQ